MSVIDEVAQERAEQDAKWGEQNHPDGTSQLLTYAATSARERTNRSAREGKVTWMHILDEEVCEAFCEEEPGRLRAELIQIAAVAVAWVEAIDRRAQQ